MLHNERYGYMDLLLELLMELPPLNNRSSHLIEAAKRGRLDQMIYFRRR